MNNIGVIKKKNKIIIVSDFKKVNSVEKNVKTVKKKKIVLS